MDLTLINLSEPIETRSFEKGRFELYRIGPMTLGRATYEPGWRWSEHVGPASGETSCRGTTAGWSGRSRMCLCTSWAAMSTRAEAGPRKQKAKSRGG